MPKSWGCNSGEIAEWRDEEPEQIAHLELPWVGAAVFRGSPESAGGFTLVWTDYVANDWAETYEVAADAVLRMGLIAACQDGGMFTEEADTPHKWAEQAMHILAAYTTGREDDA